LNSGKNESLDFLVLNHSSNSKSKILTGECNAQPKLIQNAGKLQSQQASL
jgi:hypothetical protein